MCWGQVDLHGSLGAPDERYSLPVSQCGAATPNDPGELCRSGRHYSQAFLYTSVLRLSTCPLCSSVCWTVGTVNVRRRFRGSWCWCSPCHSLPLCWVWGGSSGHTCVSCFTPVLLCCVLDAFTLFPGHLGESWRMCLGWTLLLSRSSASESNPNLSDLCVSRGWGSVSFHCLASLW